MRSSVVLFTYIVARAREVLDADAHHSIIAVLGRLGFGRHGVHHGRGVIVVLLRCPVDDTTNNRSDAGDRKTTGIPSTALFRVPSNQNGGWMREYDGRATGGCKEQREKGKNQRGKQDFRGVRGGHGAH